MAPNKKVLVFCDFYLPSKKSGGGMWTVVNLVDAFCYDLDFYVVTRNYDSKGDTTPYSDVETGEWNNVGNAKVYYLAAAELTRGAAARIVSDIGPDCIYLNSAFSLPAVKLLEARRSGKCKNIPVVLAPCGELSKGSLAIKRIKKLAFLTYAKLVGLYNGVLWKASTELEKTEIEDVFGHSTEIMVAPDLVPQTILPDFRIETKPKKASGEVRLVFLSRIVRKKNIHYFLEILKDTGHGKIVFDIVGPIEDEAYWSKCQRLIDEMPPNVTVNIVGPVSYENGLELLQGAHYFVLPTLNENFGYVFIESMAAGTPLLISDQTVWADIAQAGAGWVIPLADTRRWSEIVGQCINAGQDEYTAMSRVAREYAVSWLSESNLTDATRAVLDRALGESAERFATK